MYFRTEYAIRDFPFTRREGDGASFDYDDTHSLSVSVVPSAETVRIGYETGTKYICMGTCRRELSGGVQQGFEAIAENRMPSGSKQIDRTASGSPRDELYGSFISEQGKIAEGHGAPFDLLPQSLQSFIWSVQEELHTACLFTLKTLRWRAGVQAHHSPFASSVGSWWSWDNKEWITLPAETQIRVVLQNNPLLTVNLRADVVTLVSKGQSEPLGHEMLREARDQSEVNPRSALLLGVAAVEVGIKQCVSELLPDTKWLMENMPSPSVEKMLREFLPKLETRLTIGGKVLPPPSTTMKTIKNGVSARNTLAHAGAKSPRWDFLNEFFNAVEDILWLLDYYRGFEWSLAYVSDEVRHELRIPDEL